MLAMFVLAAAALHCPSPARAETSSRRPLQVADLKELLPWISARSIGHASADVLLRNIELASLHGLEKQGVRVQKMAAHSGDYARDVIAFEQWLEKAVPDAAARGLVLRAATQTALAQLREDGTQLHLPHKYLLPPEVEGYDKGGVGLLVDRQPDPQGRFIVFETLDGFPGSTVGLRSGDRLVKVGECSLIGLSYREMADLVRGNLGTRVKLLVERPGTTAPLSFEVERVWLNPNPKNISHKLMSDHIGYVRVKYLGERMDFELARVLDEFKRSGVKKIVLDLRNNEGLMAGCQDVGAVFLGGNAEITRLVSGGSSDVRRTHGTRSSDQPLIVLVNRYTSGAAILLAGALRDHGRARIVGEPTVWCDQPQESKELPDGSTVTVATGYYVLPGGKTLRNREHSLEPEVVIEQDPLRPLGGGDDAQLQRAVQLAR